MKTTLKLEELAQFIFSIFLFNQLDYDWWWYLALILLPDLGMIGYLVNEKVGAISYNLFHHKGIALIILIAGSYLNIEWLKLSGIILFGHSALDRIMGYGLKFEDSLKNTHLGKLT